MVVVVDAAARPLDAGLTGENADLLNAVLTDCRARRLSPSITRNACDEFSRFLRWIQLADLCWSALGAADVKRYYAEDARGAGKTQTVDDYDDLSRGSPDRFAEFHGCIRLDQSSRTRQQQVPSSKHVL
jgi:hypothetical protein